MIMAELVFLVLKLGFILRLVWEEVISKNSVRRVSIFLTKSIKFNKYL